MSDIKVLTNSEEASKYEKDADYITKNIVTENGVKYGIFEKKEKPAEKKVKEK